MDDVVIGEEFWRKRRVLLTGHTGFKGSWMSFWLQKLQAQLCGLALDPPSTPSLFEVGNVGQGMQDVRGDIRDQTCVAHTFAAFRPEIIIHMAAQSLVRPSYADPIATYATNVMGTAHVLEAARQCSSVRVILVITSDKCYENREWDRGYEETDPMGGYDPYSSSKGCAELITAAYRRSFFNPACYEDHHVAIASARAGNVIGGGDWAVDRLIPDAMRSFAMGQKLIVRLPDAIRPWQHVLEPICGYLQLAHCLYDKGPVFAQAWNFGPNVEAEQPVRYLAERVTRLWGDGAQWQALSVADAPHEAHYLKLDARKAHKELAWRPRLGLDDALALTIDWYKAFSDGRNMRDVSLAQITSYIDQSSPVASST